MAVSPSVDRLVKPAAAPDATALLADGDRVTREEFGRRYDSMPHLKKAELIEGVVHMPSPVRDDQHGDQHSCLVGWLWVYRAGRQAWDRPPTAASVSTPATCPNLTAS